MIRHSGRGFFPALGLACGVILGAAAAAAQVEQPRIRDSFPMDEPPVQRELAETVRRDVIGPLVPDPVLFEALAPDTGGTTMTWVAVVMLLALFAQGGLLRSRNLDVLVLALTALALPLRDRLGILALDQTVQWWSYAVLTACAVYWVVRGAQLVFARHVPPVEINASQRALTVLVLAGLAVAAGHIAFAPLSETSRDGIIGGQHFVESGRLPYGDIGPRDSHSPLLYLAHAGALKLLPLPVPDDALTPEGGFAPGIAPGGADFGADAAESRPSIGHVVRPTRLQLWSGDESAAARLVNAVLFLALFAALAGIGHRLHSVEMGLALCAVLCIAPPVLECTTQPEVMLPAALIAWTLAFVNLGGLGSIPATFTCMLAGLAWPWAWLFLPVLFGYYATRGWQGFGMTLGKLAGAAAVVWIVCELTAPALPRVDGALRRAGLTPEFNIRASESPALIVDRPADSQPVVSDFKSGLWRWALERDQVTLSATGAKFSPPNGLDVTQARAARMAASEEARRAMQPGYRAALSSGPVADRWLAAARTVIEATYAPSPQAETETRVGAWELWAGRGGSAEMWVWLRRGMKIVTGVLALYLGWALWRCERSERRQLVGGVLAIAAGSLLATPHGAAANLVLLMPLALALAAARSETTVVAPAAPAPLDLSARLATAGTMPRITVNR